MKHFKTSDFACKCGCGYDAVSPRLVSQLDAVVEESGAPFTIKCGCECSSRAALVHGEPVNAHVKGLGAVIETDSEKMALVADICKKYFDSVSVHSGMISVTVDKN